MSVQNPPAEASTIQKIAPLTNAEVAQIAISLQTLVGAQLQECVQSASEVGLGFYHEREMFWLWIDLNPNRPLVVRMKGKAPGRKKIMRPLQLFIKARFLGRRLASVRADLVRGRIMILTFHRAADEQTQEPCEIEVRLFPHGQNVIARDGNRFVAENKPKEVAAPVVNASPVEAGRSWEEIEEQWFALQKGKPQVAKTNVQDAAAIEKQWKKTLDKKSKALERMREELEKKTSGVYAEVGEWLKINGHLDVPAEWREYVKQDKSLSWNIEECFRRAKENLRKSQGTRERIAMLEKEIEQLKARGPGAFAQQIEREAKADAGNLLAKADARGRRLKIADDLEVYIGKSAADNLALLRRAQPFDYWLHLRDMPGSHAILRRTRGRQVTDHEFQEAGRWVVEQSIGKRAHELKGERHDLLIVECRYVRPIKGDKLGRVNYTNDRVMTLRF